MHGFEADAEDFGGSGLIVASVFEGFEDQGFFRLVDGGADANGEGAWIGGEWGVFAGGGREMG